MITLVDKKGVEVIGRWLFTTETHYVLEVNGLPGMFPIDDWEEKR